jgi:hypothetical protein
MITAQGQLRQVEPLSGSVAEARPLGRGGVKVNAEGVN